MDNCGLVFDGKVVVNKDLQTIDPHIYSAGNATKFVNRY